MGILQEIKKSIDFLGSSATSIYSGLVGKSESELQLHQPVVTEWFFQATMGIPRNEDLQKVRDFAKSSSVQMCINTIIKAVLETEWRITKADEEDETDYETQIQELTDFFKVPLKRDIGLGLQTYSGLVSPFIRDILEIDAGIIHKVFSADSYELVDDTALSWRVMKLKPMGTRTLLGLNYADGATFLKRLDPYNKILNWFQYSWRHPRALPRYFDTEEIIEGLVNKRSYKNYGYSPLQSIQQIVETLEQSIRYNKEFFIKNAIPAGLLSLKGMDSEQLQLWISKWNDEFKANPHRIAMTNADADFKQFAASNKDMEWLDGQKWYQNLVCAAFALSPAIIGLTQDVAGKSVQGGQERTTLKYAIQPYLNKLEELFNLHVIPELLGTENPPLEFRYFPQDSEKEKIEFENDMKEIEHKTMSINEYREKQGRAPIESEYADNPLQAQEESFEMKGNSFNPLQSFVNRNEDNKAKPKRDDQEPKKEEKKSFNQLDSELVTPKAYDVLRPGNDVVDEAKGYDDFFDKQIDRWEKKVIQAVEQEDLTKSFDIIEKSLGGFISRLFNTINTANFRKILRRIIKLDMIKGIDDAEKEIGVNVIFGEQEERTLKQFENEQIDGYTTPDGHKWPGLKGVTNQINLKVLQTVQKGMNEGKSEKQIAEDIKTVFKGVKNSRAACIARTETTRFYNKAKLDGFKQSGVDGFKKWVTFHDGATTDVCKKLSGQIVPIGKNFHADADDFSFDGEAPPAHYNCRSIIQFKLEK